VVVRRPDEERFIAELDDQLAELTYRLVGRRLVIVHTGVPAPLEGRGVGSALVRAAVDWATAEGYTVVPGCPFARGWLRRHPEAAASVEVDWSATPSR